MRLAILGGSFNPVHLGHLYVADEVRRSLAYERVLFVPAGTPVHKSLDRGASDEDRLNMLELALADRSELRADDCELRRGGASYTIDTVRDLVQRYPVDGKPGLIIGDDLVAEFHTWKQAGVLASMVELIVARRVIGTPGERPPDAGWGFPCTYVDNPLYPVSSSEIRRRVRLGQSVQGLVPEAVRRYIDRHGLYA